MEGIQNKKEPSLVQSRFSSRSEIENPASFFAKVFIVLSLIVWVLSLRIGFDVGVTILMVIGLVGAVIGYLVPSLGLLAIAFLATLDAVASIFVLTGGLLRFNTLNYMLLVVMLVSLPFLLRLKDLNSRLLEIFVIILLVQLIMSPDITNGIQDILNVVTMFGLVVYLARALDNQEAFYWMGIVNGFLAGVGSLVFNLQIDQLPYANPNVWSFFPMTALFSICISFPIANKLKRGRTILLLLAAVNFTWIFLSGSRGNLLISIVCIIYLFYTARKPSLRTLMIVVAVGASIGIMSQFTEMQTEMLERLQMTFDPTKTLVSRSSHRLLIAQAGWYIFQDNPFGIGTGGFSKAVSNIDILAGNGRPAHSAWVKVLAENGIQGTLVLLAFVISFSFIGWQKRHKNGMLALGLFVTAAFGVAFISKEYQGKSMWMLAAFAIVLMHQTEIQKAMKSTKTRFQGSYFTRRLHAKTHRK